MPSEAHLLAHQTALQGLLISAWTPNMLFPHFILDRKFSLRALSRCNLWLGNSFQSFFRATSPHLMSDTVSLGGSDVIFLYPYITLCTKWCYNSRKPCCFKCNCLAQVFSTNNLRMRRGALLVRGQISKSPQRRLRRSRGMKMRFQALRNPRLSSRSAGGKSATWQTSMRLWHTLLLLLRISLNGVKR